LPALGMRRRLWLAHPMRLELRRYRHEPSPLWCVQCPLRRRPDVHGGSLRVPNGRDDALRDRLRRYVEQSHELRLVRPRVRPDRHVRVRRLRL
jgi:hypothetical protein